MSNLLKTLGENRRDCVWFFILGSLVVGYGMALMDLTQFLSDSNASLIPLVAGVVTTTLLGGVSLAVGGALLIHGISVLIKGGSSEL